MTLENVALLLPGGGAAGIKQFGMLLAFLESGIQYSSLHSASVGSLNGVMLKQGKIDQLKNIWLNIENKDVYSYSPWKLFTEEGSFFDTKPLRKLLSESCGPKPIWVNNIPWYINTTDIVSERTYTLEINDVTDLPSFLLASASPPLAFPAVKYEDKLLSDGGLLNNFSISQAVKSGADNLIILMPRSKLITSGKPKNAFDYLNKLIMMPSSAMYHRELQFINILNSNPKYRHINVIVVFPDDRKDISIIDFSGLGSKEEREDIIYSNYLKAKLILNQHLN